MVRYSNRMDSGRLESLSRVRSCRLSFTCADSADVHFCAVQPYAFHKVLRSLFIPLVRADSSTRMYTTQEGC
jgi:hypothetical protein